MTLQVLTNKLYSRAKQNTETGCVELPSQSARRYVSVVFDGLRTNAHRAVWMAFNGAIPDGFCVCHRCDNTRCISPDHLFLGTVADNMRDRDSKGRCGTLGSKSPLAKLNESQARAIRDSSEPVAKLAVDFGVSAATVIRIRTRRSWKHLN